MTTSPQHQKAQWRILHLLSDYYHLTSVECFTPAPNNKYIYDDENEFSVKPYLLDVYASMPKDPELTRYDKLGIEIDGSVGHKKTKRQYVRDTQREKDILAIAPDIKIFRYDTKDLVGRGYVNPKTKKRHAILTDAEILAELGVKSTHV